ncbi:MAG: hypothetical protein L0L39_02880 [Atopostipes suicloacalis]|nr:hypothetical protein [Atopostipes suicloacalis]
MTNYEFTDQLLKNLGVKSIEKVFERHWYAERNFHGQYYLDSAILNDFLDFRRESFDDFLERLENHLTYPQKVLACFPDFFIKHIFMKALALGKGGSLSWKKEKDLERIKAFYGTTENYEKLRTWEDFELPNNLNQIRFINHGYDEGKKESLLNLSDMKNAANFRGGKCLSKSMKTGDVDSKLKWECAFSHKFEASPRLVLFAGHWCPKCAAPPWQDAMIASKNPFFAQVYSSKTDQMS